MLLALAAPLMAPVPAFGVPGLFDAFWGWLATLIALALPFALLGRRAHFIFGHWTRLFAQWRRRSWWLLVAGALAWDAGVFIILAALPAWQSHWQTWYPAAQTAYPKDGATLAWLSLMHDHLAQVLQLGALALILLGIGALAISIRHLLRNVLIRRQAVAATAEWIMGPPPLLSAAPEEDTFLQD
jgi:hypothetical protein